MASSLIKRLDLFLKNGFLFLQIIEEMDMILMRFLTMARLLINTKK